MYSFSTKIVTRTQGERQHMTCKVAQVLVRIPNGFAHLCFDLVRISCSITFPALGIKWKAPLCYRMASANSSNSFSCQLTIRTTQLAENVASSLLDWLKQSCSGT